MHNDEHGSGRGDPQGPVAFVAGATGYAGRALVAELRRRRVRTVAHVRPDSPRLEEWREHFTGTGAGVDETAWDDDAMAAALARHRPDVVYALLGTTRRRGRAARAAGAEENYETVDYGLSALLLRAAQRAVPHARFVYLSAMGVGPGSRGGYVRARWRVEEALRRSGLAWTIARPAFVTGPDREEPRPAERIMAAIGDGLLGAARLLGGRRLYERFHSLDAATLARGLAEHGLDPASAGRVLTPESLRR